MEEFTTKLLEIALSLLTLVLGYFGSWLIVKLKRYFEMITASLQAEKNQWLRELSVINAVKWAEQICTDLDGAEKLEKVIDRVTTELNGKGVPIHQDQLRTLIESVVFDIKHSTSPEVPEEI
jgi:hypothetical protein